MNFEIDFDAHRESSSTFQGMFIKINVYFTLNGFEFEGIYV